MQNSCWNKKVGLIIRKPTKSQLSEMSFYCRVAVITKLVFDWKSYMRTFNLLLQSIRLSFLSAWQIWTTGGDWIMAPLSLSFSETYWFLLQASHEGRRHRGCPHSQLRRPEWGVRRCAALRPECGAFAGPCSHQASCDQDRASHSPSPFLEPNTASRGFACPLFVRPVCLCTSPREKGASHTVCSRILWSKINRVLSQ